MADGQRETRRSYQSHPELGHFVCRGRERHSPRRTDAKSFPVEWHYIAFPQRLQIENNPRLVHTRNGPAFWHRWSFIREYIILPQFAEAWAILTLSKYAPVLFAQAGIPGEQASFLASGLSAILMLAISVPGFLLADKWGRRTSAISGGLILSACMLIIGSLYASSAVHPYGITRWVVVVLVFAFGLTFSATWGIVGKIYASEIQPSNTRAAANCVAQGLSFVSR